MPRNLKHPDPLRALRSIQRLESKLANDKEAAVEAARAAGKSWGQIGHAMGVNRAAAYRWYQRRCRPATVDERSDSTYDDRGRYEGDGGSDPT
jgi:hypothetical protein